MSRNEWISALVFHLLLALILIVSVIFLYTRLSITLFVAVVLILLVLYTLISLRVLLEPQRRSMRALQHYTDTLLHEINVPVATILSNSDLIKRGCDEQILKRVSRIERAAKRLHHLYEEMEYRIKQSHAIQQVDVVSVDNMLQQLVDEFQSVHTSRIFRLHLERLDAKLDRIGLISVFSNLLDNAIKYSNSASAITVTITGSAVHICDEGRGMDAVERLRIFEAFYQENQKNRGIGLGLSVVKSYCDQYHIALHIVSKPLEGTTISLDFSEVNHGT